METSPSKSTLDIPLKSPVGNALRAALPELPYSLRDHKKSIAIVWGFLIANSCLLPIALFYGLWYGTDLDHNVLFGIVTGVLGVMSLIQYWIRMWHLLKEDPSLRPLGSRRGWLDYFQISYTIGIAVVTALLVTGTSHSPPLIRILALPPSALILLTSTQLLLFILLSALHIRTPFRISSLPRGVPIRPGIYVIIEDVIALDAGAGRAYREALNERYEASLDFRRMLGVVNLFWAVGGTVAGGVVMGVCLAGGVEEQVAFGVGWTVPFLWAGVWAIGTIWYVQGQLRKEKEAWGVGGKGQAGGRYEGNDMRAGV